MNIKELLLQEIESSSDVLLAETLDFLRFLKTKPGTEEISLDLSTEKMMILPIRQQNRKYRKQHQLLEALKQKTY